MITYLMVALSLLLLIGIESHDSGPVQMTLIIFREKKDDFYALIRE